MENSELIALLRNRGFEVKSASSTIDNISAESLRQEYRDKPEAKQALEEGDKKLQEAAANAELKPKGGAIVRTKEEVEKERLEREEAEKPKEPRLVRPANAPAKVAPPGKAPPPLPRTPGPVVRAPSKPATPPSKPAGEGGTSSPGVRAPALRVPVVRSDLPKEEEQPKEEKASAPAPVSVPKKAQAPAPIAPPKRTGPAPVAPPAAKKAAPPAGPKTVAPPPAGPKNVAPPQPTKEEDPGGSEKLARPLQKLQVKPPIVVRDFAVQIGKKPFQLISELMEMNIFASMNTSIDEEVASRIAANHGYELEIRHRGEAQPQGPATPKEEKVEDVESLEPRPPVICILGHVDHGKTTLLDTIRKTNVVAGEAGGITQHIGAYQIEHEGKKITFIDTPGHAAFSNMRARGANTTDIAVLVVAADDGFMPQTDEALGHARAAKVPVVVAINKTDAPGANIDRVKRQMQERELSPEEWGGETLSAEVSALKGTGIENLLESILLQAEIMDTLTADRKAKASGVVLEAQKELGRGSTASVIVQKGTLKTGLALVCGEAYCRVRQLVDDKGKPIKEAGPSTPAKIVGWTGTPDAGDVFETVKNEREAKRIAEERELERKKLESRDRQEGGASLDDLFAAIAKTRKKTYRVVVKADVYGTAEALAHSLMSIKSDKIDLDVVEMGVGNVTRNDVLLASAAEASIVGFNVGQDNGVPPFAKHHNVKVLQHNIIYELIQQVRDAMADLLEPELRENKIGAAEVRQVFPLAKGFVAGCMVTEGRIQRDAPARVMRKNRLEKEANIVTLKRFKEDVSEVRAGYECGIQVADFNGYQEGDIIEVFEILKIKPDL